LDAPGPIVVSRWRSQAHGVDRGRTRARRIASDELQERLAASADLLQASRPHLEWLAAYFADIRHVVYLTDADGVVLASFGDPESQQEFALLPGNVWSEREMGTNGAGTALATGRPVVVQ